MIYIKQYINIICYSLIGLVFGFASFYLFTNCYHYLELRKDFISDISKQPVINEIDEKMVSINNNVSNYNTNNYNRSISNMKIFSIRQNIISCVDSFNNSTYKEIKEKDRVSIIDVYNFRESYENDILNNCFANNLYWLKNIDNDIYKSKYMKNNYTLVNDYLESIMSNTSYLKKDLINNSSYFFNTSIASSLIKDNTRDGFYEVVDSYNKALKLIDFLSNWFKNYTEGNYD